THLPIFESPSAPRYLHSFPTRRSSDLCASAGGPFPTYAVVQGIDEVVPVDIYVPGCPPNPEAIFYGILKLQEKVQQQTIARTTRSEEHTSELQSQSNLVCRLLLEKKKR